MTPEQIDYCSSVDMDPAYVRDLEDGTWIHAKPLIFHWTVIRGTWFDPIGYFDRWCYADEKAAVAALHSFPLRPPAGWEPEGWHRHPKSGRRLVEGEIINSP